MSARDANTPNYDIYRNSETFKKREIFMQTYNTISLCNTYFEYRGFKDLKDIDKKITLSHDFLKELSNIYCNMHSSIQFLNDLQYNKKMYPWFPFDL